MALDHELIRKYLRFFGVAVFIYACYLKLKNILNTKSEIIEDDTEDEVYIDSPTQSEPEPPLGAN